MKHTPGPLKIYEEDNGQFSRLGLKYSIFTMKGTDGGPEAVCLCYAKANAHHIVKCVNTHAQLLKALKEITEAKGAYSQDRLEHCSNTVRDMVELANIALAAATEGEQHESLVWL